MPGTAQYKTWWSWRAWQGHARTLEYGDLGLGSWSPGEHGMIMAGTWQAWQQRNATKKNSR
jgi:hypothetical protein